jgi:hypothetical protein
MSQRLFVFFSKELESKKKGGPFKIHLIERDEWRGPCALTEGRKNRVPVYYVYILL